MKEEENYRCSLTLDMFLDQKEYREQLEFTNIEVEEKANIIKLDKDKTRSGSGKYTYNYKRG